MNSYDEWSALLDAYGRAIGAAALKTLHIHLSGIAYGPKGEKEHLKLKEADLDLKALFRALHDHGCAGRILCESPIMEKDALTMKRSWIRVSGEKAR